jgi:hypothetical protein
MTVIIRDVKGEVYFELVIDGVVVDSNMSMQALKKVAKDEYGVDVSTIEVQLGNR